MSLTVLRAPRDLHQAYRTLTDPGAHGCLPAVIQTNWQFLKEGRGERFYPERLVTPAHLITPATPAPAEVNEIDAARLSAIPLIRRAMRNLGLEPQGAA